MFGSLRTRLLLTYVALVTLTLMIIAGAFVLILVNNPVPLSQSYRHLADIARASRPYIRQSSPDQLNARLAELAQDNAVRLLQTSASGQVLFDSTQSSANQPTIDVKPIKGGEQDIQRGYFRDAQGQIWLTVTYAKAPATVDPGSTILFAVERPPNRVFTLLDDLMLPVAEAGAIGIVLSIIFAVVVSNWVSGPLARTAVAARAIAGGDYTLKAPVQGLAEVHDLGSAFNEMVAKVQTTNETQRDFLANVSHELKTPLTSIQGFAQAILDGAATQPAEAARVIYDEAGRMRRLVEDLLDLARIESGNAQLRREVLDVSDIVRRVGDNFKLRADKKGVVLTTHIGNLPLVTGDADRLVQVFSNLTENALEHTPQGGRIGLAAEPVPGGVQVSVADTGKGIPPEDTKRIFERFYQADKSRARAGRRGTGLGLTICREIIQAHGGSIQVESTEGRGSTFYVWLPLPRSSDETARRASR